MLSNTVCQDARLTMRALGVLVRLLSRPDNWRTNSETLAKEFGCGRDAVRGAMHELQAAGYIQVKRVQAENGQISTQWVVFDDPQEIAEAAQPEAGKADAGQTGDGKPGAGEGGALNKTDRQKTEKQKTEGQKERSRAPAPDEFSPPDWIDPQAWAGYTEMRKRIRKPATNRALELVVRELEKLQRAGDDHAAVLDQSTRNSWVDVYAIKDKSQQQQRPGRPAPQPYSDAEVVAEVIRRRAARGLDNGFEVIE